ncbi:polyamine oxidase (exo-N4-amino) 1 [Ictalurus furcatus]|uniref:polyamine oxidase (exo-N4-amino) 1 n=1 Tax=Ictalurus furcatus TaxID=66913 RepID=UPI0023507D91|nr:polyamine oxidase (exo-N4-amino) 1 [Ictalurus furcatus]
MFTSAYSRSRATSGFLSQVPKEGKSIFYRCTGCKVDEDFSEHVYEAGERIMRYYGNIGERIGEHFAEKAQELIEMYKADEKMVVQSILSLVGKQFLLHIGASDLHNVSLASWQYYINMGEDLNVEGLMFQMVEKLVEDFPKECLLLNKAVSKIKWDGAFCGKEGRVYPVCVVCEDRDEIM